MGNVCPIMRGTCIEKRCMFWIHLRGTNKNTGQEMDEEGCAIAWLPALLVENAAMQRETGAAVESLRNESVRAEDATRKVLIAGLGIFDDRPTPKQLEGDRHGGS